MCGITKKSNIDIDLIESGDFLILKDEKTPRLVVLRNERLHTVSQEHYAPLDGIVSSIIGVYRPDSNQSLAKIFRENASELVKDTYNFEEIALDDDTKEVTLEEVAEKFGVDSSKIRIKE